MGLLFMNELSQLYGWKLNKQKWSVILSRKLTYFFVNLLNLK